MSSVSAVNNVLSTTTTASTVNISSILAAVAGVSTPGIDVNAAVTAAIYADRAPERGWQAQEATLTSQTTALTAIQTATTTINTDMASLNSLTGPLSARTVTSSNSSYITGTAASGTVSGNHAVVVGNVATTGAWYSDLMTSPTAALPVTTFTLTTAAGASTTITTGSGVNTLNDVATSINGSSLGVTATVISDATGSRLAIISNTSGAAADFSMTSQAAAAATTWSSPTIPTGDSLGVNSFTITPTGGTATTITTTSGETYAQLATSINSQNLGVTASSVNDSNGTHLSIVSNSATTFQVSEPTFSFTSSSTGGDANLTVDGVPVKSASNTVTGALLGVTLNLLGATNGSTVNLTVAADAGQVSTAINQFVTDYNAALALVNTQFSSSSAGLQGVLGSDPTVRALQNSLLQAVNYVNTPASGTTTVSALSALGISAGTGGTLSIDSSTLNTILATNPSDVQSFFQGASQNGFANTLTTQLTSFTNPGTGSFSVDLSSISKTNTDLATHISTFESIYIAQQQTILTAMYSQAEIALQSLPTQLAQIQAELGNTSKSGG